MEQSMGEDTITITGDNSGSNSYVINLNDTYGATTSYFSNDNTGVIATDVGTVLSSAFTITSSGNVGIGTISTINSVDFNWYTTNTHLEVAEVEKMCAEYPALAKVYENFKTMYDLVKQDWEGKKNAENNS
jgi:hypothetical protein